MSLKCLKNILLANCKNWVFTSVWKTYVESLQISNMGRVTKVGLEFLGVERGRGATITEEGQTSSSSSSTSVIVFPKLIHLTFEDMEEWEYWKYDIPVSSCGEVTIQVMPRFRSLTLLYCPWLRSLPDHLQDVTLKEVTIRRCPRLEESYNTTTILQHVRRVCNWSLKLQGTTETDCSSSGIFLFHHHHHHVYFNSMSCNYCTNNFFLGPKPF